MKNPVKAPGKMSIQKATASYEKWLGEQIPLLPADLERKHEAMRRSEFLFLRATYYRWTQLWPQVKKSVSAARQVLAVGDLHIENFGTWRDAEGRLVWGINDFDEAHRLPYTYDLVRLAASARLAIAEAALAMAPREADAAILSGYREGLEAGGQPFVLAERWRALWQLAMARLERPDEFWERLEALPAMGAGLVPESAVRALGTLLPGNGLAVRYAHRIAGAGSLGRQRFVAIVDWCGGNVAREAKATARSAFLWSHRGDAEPREIYREILTKAVRCQDPFVAVKRRWIVRRLAPDCSRIELAELPRQHEIVRLLHAMGWETANIHLGSASAPALLVDLVSRPEGWLREAAKEMLKEVHADWEAWRKAPRKQADEGQEET
jgi:hypothetical protein